MPKTFKERAIFTLMNLAIASFLIAGLVWVWSSYTARPPLDAVINWAPAIAVSLSWLVYTCMRRPRSQK